ncbi:MAG: Crp/Fnr family transcriptional regulator [Planctomycetes bacterium]|nr:Crp/Fnr family transcriptional regulator [Planctomycetota bacterium]
MDYVLRTHDAIDAPRAAEPDARDARAERPGAGALLRDVLRSVEFLHGASPEVLTKFMSLGHSRRLAKGHVFWTAGQSAQSVVIPVDGELALMRSNAGGRELCHGFFGTGDCAGLQCVLSDHPHVADARAIRGGEFFTVDRSTILRFLDEHPTARAIALSAVGRMYRNSVNEREGLVFLPLDARLAQFLLANACMHQGDGARVLLRATHAEIAARIGSVREVVARTMADFAKQGLIRHTYDERFILRWDGLGAQAGVDRPDPVLATAAAESASRTRRFAMPILRDGRAATNAAAAACGRHVADIARCVGQGCPIAVAARASATPERTVSPPTPAVAPAARIAVAPLFARADKTQPAREARVSAALPPARQSATRGTSERQTPTGSATLRDPYEERVIARRVVAYTQRAATIETEFGSVDRVPSYVSLFCEPQTPRAAAGT